jgi:hypothetical protein
MTALSFKPAVWKRMGRMYRPGSPSYAPLRRLALVGLLSAQEGQTLSREVLMQAAFSLLGPGAFGDDPQRTFGRDIKALQAAGFNIRCVQDEEQQGYCYSSEPDPVQHMREQISRLHPVQVAAWRRMTPGERLALADQLFVEAREAARRDERRRHPHLSEEEIHMRVLRRMHGRHFPEGEWDGTHDAERKNG